MSNQNKALIRRYIEEVWSKGDLDSADEIIHADAHPPHGFEDMPSGPEGFKQFVTMLRATFPDLHREADDLVAEGDRVVARIIERGTHQGTFVGLPPSGIYFTINGIDIYRSLVRFEDGRITEEWEMSG